MENEGNILKYAGVLLITPDGQVIMQQRDNNHGIENPGRITIFGGGIEEGETPIKAAIREIREELQLNLEEKNLSELVVYRKTKERHGKDVICHIFIAENIDPNNLKVSEGLGFVLISKDSDLSKLNLTILATDILKEYFVQ